METHLYGSRELHKGDIIVVGVVVVALVDDDIGHSGSTLVKTRQK